jgi:hypothetical protein
MKNSKFNIKLMKQLVRSIERTEDLSISQLMELLCQISLALLIIFIMADILNDNQMNVRLEEIQKEKEHWQNKYQEIANTTVGEQYELRQQAVIELQKQKLINALEKVEFESRRKYGLIYFSNINSDGGTEFYVEDILKGSKVINSKFIKACRLIKDEFQNKGRIQKEWLSEILDIEGMQMYEQNIHEADQDGQNTSCEIITKKNTEWLLHEIDYRANNLYIDCIQMQRAVLSHIQLNLRNHPETLKGTYVHSLVQKYLKATPQEQEYLIDVLCKELYKYAKSLLYNQGIPLLNEV